MAKEADNRVEGDDDPFNRALAREQAYRERFNARRSRSGVPRMVFWFALAFMLGWAGLLAVHWAVFAEPRWLAVLHTMVFGFFFLKVIGAALFATVIGRKRGLFGVDFGAD